MNTALKLLGIAAGLGIVLKLASARRWDCSQCAKSYVGCDCIVQKSEAVQAVVDYFDGLITKACAVEIVALYYAQGGRDVPPP